MLEYVAIAERHFGVRFVPVTRNEFRSLDGCPWCKDGGNKGDGDRFRLFTTGRSGPRVWCRQCGGMMFLDTLEEHKKMSEEEIAALTAQLKARREEENEKQQSALEAIAGSHDHLAYHKNLESHREAVDYWHNEGIKDETISRHMLGWCPACPTAMYSPSYTIPIMYQGKLYNIRHRLERPNGAGKYRPHIPGLPVMLFNADDLNNESNFGLLLEGEKKTMVVSQETGLPSVGIMGMSSFSQSWVPKFDKWGLVYVTLDPDADNRAYSIAKMFGDRGRIVSLPVKADDFFFRVGARINAFTRFLKMARPV